MEEEFKNFELEEKGWDKYFEGLSKRSRKHSFDIGDSTNNKLFNRYVDVLPYDKSRIKLTRAGDIDYINANLVTVPKAARQYILTQGPLPETISHFWCMVWEQKSTVIVMLNRCVELENFVKCEQYWPGRVEASYGYPDVELNVTLTSVEEKKHFTIRHLLLQDDKTQKSREILQFQYKAWPDHGQPNSPTSFLRLLTAIRKSGGLDKMDEPTIVHCSAGIGRSGTFCLIDSVLSMVENQGSTEGIEISNTLIEMRDYRMGLIQSPVQLRFAYMSIIYGIKILERANKLHPHMSSMTAVDKASRQKSTNGTLQTNGKKSRRNKKKQTSSSTFTPLNVFNKHQLVEAMDEIDSDDADNLFEDSMKHLPSLKKARNSEPERSDLWEQLRELTRIDSSQQAQEVGEGTDKQVTAATKAQLLTNAINNLLAESKISQNSDLSTNSLGNQNTDSVLLRRRERELRNQKLAEKTQDIKNRMKAEELKKERRATRLAFLKKSAVVGGVAILLSSIAYMYLHSH